MQKCIICSLFIYLFKYSLILVWTSGYSSYTLGYNSILFNCLCCSNCCSFGALTELLLLCCTLIGCDIFCICLFCYHVPYFLALYCAPGLLFTFLNTIISHFFKESIFLLFKNVIRNQDIGTGCAFVTRVSVLLGYLMDRSRTCICEY